MKPILRLLSSQLQRQRCSKLDRFKAGIIILTLKMRYAICCAVNFYNATGSLARLENKNILVYFEKRCNLLQCWRCTYVAVR
jgi:hypothetical protein